MAYLLEPLTIGSLVLSNRLVMPPMATAKAAPDGSVTREILDYYDEKSRGGYFSLIIIEHSYISPEGKARENQLSIADDQVLEGLKKLAGAIHRNGSKAVMQINHAGSAARGTATEIAPVAPSAIPHPRGGDIPQELSREEINQLILAFRKAAGRAKAAGFDGVELHSAHGYLLNQFFSPLTNRRSDSYGGTVQNRIRLHLQVIEAVRQAVGMDFPILLRLGADDYRPGGISLEDSQFAAQAFEKAGIAILDITGSFLGYNSPESSEPGYFAPLSEPIRQAVSIPVILTGGIKEPESAERLLAAGKADLIGVGRAVLNDSLWAEHAIETLRNSN